jgi:hypothetical protein
MRTYYKSDKKRREETKKRKSDEKRARRLNKNSKNVNQPEADETRNAQSMQQAQDLKN